MQFLDADVAEVDLVAVILKDDVTASARGEPGNRCVLARGERLRHLGRAELVVDDFFAVEPVLTMIAVEHDDGVVPLADRREAFLVVGGTELGERAGRMGCELSIGMAIVVEHLILERLGRVPRRNGRRELLRHVVLHAAVGAGRRLPIPRELEVAERPDADEITALERLSVGLHLDLATRDLLDRAVLAGPVTGRHVGKTKPPPSDERQSIEEKTPTAARVFGRWRSGSRRCGRLGRALMTRRDESESN